MRKIFGPKRDDQTGEWRRLHNGGDVYGKPDIIIIVKVSQTAMGRACDTNGKLKRGMKTACRKTRGEAPSR